MERIFRAKNLVVGGIFLCGKILSDVPSVPMPESNISPSLRMQGLGSELTGIMTDNLTDMLWNPARLPMQNEIVGEYPNKVICVFPGPFGLKLGTVGEISRYISNYSTESSYSEYYDKYYYFNKQESYLVQQNGILLISKNISDKSVFGIKYKYENFPYEMKEISVYNKLDTTQSPYDYYRVVKNGRNSLKNNRTDLTHSFTIGWFQELSKNSDLELLFGVQLNDRNTYSFSERKYSDTTFRKRQYNDTSGYVNFVANNRMDFLGKQNDIATPVSIGIGGKYSKKLSDRLTFRIASMTYVGKGTVKSISDSGSSYHFRRAYYYSYVGADTTWYSDSSSYSSVVPGDSLTGEAIVVSGFFKTGGEINVASNIIAGFGLYLSYSYLDLPIKGIIDTVPTEESYSYKSISIGIPFGFEYTFPKDISLRIGLLAIGRYHSSIIEENNVRIEVSYFRGPFFTKTAGFGWKLSPSINLDIYARGFTNVEAWSFQIGYKL